MTCVRSCRNGSHRRQTYPCYLVGSYALSPPVGPRNRPNYGSHVKRDVEAAFIAATATVEEGWGFALAVAVQRHSFITYSNSVPRGSITE